MQEQEPQAAAYFNAASLPKPGLSYVCWLDVMGASSVMERSLSMAANFVCKLHQAVLQAPHNNLQLYPVMDGLYATATKQAQMKEFLTAVFNQLATMFVHEKELYHRFIPKAAIAFGPVLHGREIPASASPILEGNTEYRNTLLLGMPMIQAYIGERRAPPFGVYIHESARAFAPTNDKPFSYVWWQWFANQDELAGTLNDQLGEYYDWCAKNPHAILYELERIKEHRALAAEYFVNLKPVGPAP